MMCIAPPQHGQVRTGSVVGCSAEVAGSKAGSGTTNNARALAILSALPLLARIAARNRAGIVDENIYIGACGSDAGDLVAAAKVGSNAGGINAKIAADLSDGNLKIARGAGDEPDADTFSGERSCDREPYALRCTSYQRDTPGEFQVHVGAPRSVRQSSVADFDGREADMFDFINERANDVED